MLLLVFIYHQSISKYKSELLNKETDVFVLVRSHTLQPFSTHRTNALRAHITRIGLIALEKKNNKEKHQNEKKNKKGDFLECF